MFASVRKKRRKIDPADLSPVERLSLRAEEALDGGDFQTAIECFQAALEQAPMNRDLREGLADALLMSAEEAPAGRQAKSSWRAPSSREVVSPCPPAKKTPSRPRPKPASDKPKGFELLDLEEQMEALPDSQEIAERQPPRRRTPPRTPQRTRGSRWFTTRSLTLALLYAGGLLIAAGVLHGMITGWMIPGSLPAIDQEKPLPAELTLGLESAGELLFAAKPAEALDELRLLKMDFPEHSEAITAAMVQAHRSMGARYLDERAYEKATQAYQAAAELDPQGSANWIDLARTHREHGRTVQSRSATKGRESLRNAIAAYERALAVSPNDPAALFGLAQVHAFLNDRTRAVENYQKVIATAPGSPEANMARQNLAQLTGR